VFEAQNQPCFGPVPFGSSPEDGTLAVVQNHMSLADELRALTLNLTLDPADELLRVSAYVDHADWMLIDEDEDGELYRWTFTLTVPLVDGELRRAWREGSHDDANLGDNLPAASTCVPASALTSPVRVRVQGEIVFDAGPRVAWDQELECDREVGKSSIAIVVGGPVPALVPLVPRAAPERVRALAVRADKPRIVCCLPERGLLQHTRTGYQLHTPSGVRTLPELDAIIQALPGSETAHRQYRGGPRGRLAIESQRNHREHVVIIEVDDTVRLLCSSDAMTLTRGGFDATGSLLIVRTHARRRADENTEVFESWTQVFDCDAKQLLDWRGPSADLNGRWDIVGDVLAGTTSTTMHRVPRTGEASSTRVSVDVGSHPNSAWNPVSGVAAWSDRSGPELPQALHCYHSSWGVRALAMPMGGGSPLAVLRDGRIVAHGDGLLVVDPTRQRIDKICAIENYPGELPFVVEQDGAAQVWTNDPACWCVEIPPS
jgi:hypothetical protein